MARERYLIGVDPEELKAPPPPPEKKTGFFENLWYHYKWHLLIGGFVLLLLILAVITMVTKDRPGLHSGAAHRRPADLRNRHGAARPAGGGRRGCGRATAR